MGGSAVAMKLALVLNDARPLLQLRAALVQAARDDGWDVVIIAPPHPDVDPALHAPWHLSRRGTNPFSERRSLRELERILQDAQPDVVHAFTLKAVVYASLAAKHLQLPVAATVTGLGQAFLGQGIRNRILRAVVQRSLRRALRYQRAQAVFQNGDDRQVFLDAHLVAPERTRIVPGSGIDTTRFAPTPLPPAPVVVLPTRMLTTKGVPEFVEAARILRNRGINAQWRLVGAPDPDNAASIDEATLRAWNDEGIVSWTGPSTDMPAVYAAARIVCLPSHGEGVPNVLLEGAACGRPLVATNVAGCRDVVRDGVTGLLVPVRDPEALANALQRILGDDKLAHRLGDAGRALVCQDYEVGRINKQYLALYRELAPTTK